MRKRIGKIALFLAIVAAIALIAFASGCVGNNTGLSLAGTVKHDIYENFGYGDGPDNEYSLNIKVTNTGSDTITYDVVKIYFDRGDGKGLEATVIGQDETTKDVIVKKLNSFQSDEIYAQTDGYTMDILKHTKNGKVALHITFLYKGEVVDTFHAVLPTLLQYGDKPPELPLWKEAPLHFTQDYNAVMAEVQKE